MGISYRSECAYLGIASFVLNVSLYERDRAYMIQRGVTFDSAFDDHYNLNDVSLMMKKRRKS